MRVYSHQANAVAKAKKGNIKETFASARYKRAISGKFIDLISIYRVIYVYVQKRKCVGVELIDHSMILNIVRIKLYFSSETHLTFISDGWKRKFRICCSRFPLASFIAFSMLTIGIVFFCSCLYGALKYLIEQFEIPLCVNYIHMLIKKFCVILLK